MAKIEIPFESPGPAFFIIINVKIFISGVAVQRGAHTTSFSTTTVTPETQMIMTHGTKIEDTTGRLAVLYSSKI